MRLADTMLTVMTAISGVLLLAPGGLARDTSAQSESHGPAYLGLGVAPMPPALTAQLPEETGRGRGVLVARVAEGSPAEKAGFRRHDVLVRYDDQHLYSPEQLVKLVRNDEPGRKLQLAYVRRGEIHEVEVTLAEAPGRGRPGELASRRRSNRAPDRSGSAFQRDLRRDERERQNDPRPWATFKSLTITKLDDGRYKAEIDFRNKDEKLVHRDYIGTREEIRKAIENDTDLPEDERRHLLRSLDQQSPVFPLVLPPSFRELFEQDRDPYEWPGSRF